MGDGDVNAAGGTSYLIFICSKYKRAHVTSNYGEGEVFLRADNGGLASGLEDTSESCQHVT